MLTPIQELARQWTAAQPGVSIFISSVIPDVHDAQDVLQDVAAAIFSYDIEKQGVPNSFRAWAMGIARHKAIDFYRRKSARGRAKLMDAETIDHLVRANEEIADEIDDRREALHQCMGQMPPKARQLLDMRYKSNLSPGEIATRSNTGESAVKMALFRLRNALRECIERRLAHGAGGV
ncbi:MAG: sigma-70 family RNA polymerase sigma factor [Phycisphaerae bacterium]